MPVVAGESSAPWERNTATASAAITPAAIIVNDFAVDAFFGAFLFDFFAMGNILVVGSSNINECMGRIH